MFSHFANTAGFWALMGIPAVIFIHFLQQRSRKLRVSTLFLMDALPPESSTGRVLDRIRSSRSLWLQLLAVLLCTWILAEPRFVRDNSSQTVAIVLDDSATMRVFLEDAREAALKVIKDYDGKAQQTHWIIMGSTSRNQALYRGPESAQAKEAVNKWMPGSATHDLSRALQVASTLTDRNGYSWFITDTEDKCPLNQAAIGVGRPLLNVGFVGSVAASRDGIAGWRVAIKNNSPVPQQRRWNVNVEGTVQEQNAVDLPANGIEEFFVALPKGASEMIISLQKDEFAFDDDLPLVKPEPRKLKVSLETKEKTREFFQKLLSSMEGVELTVPTEANLRILNFQADAADPLSARKAPPGYPSILGIAPKLAERSTLALHPIVPEREPVLEGLSWNGLLCSGPVVEQAPPDARILLWQNDHPLAWMEGNSLAINWDWESSNASRLPSFVLLVRRYLQNIQNMQTGTFAENLPVNTRLRIANADTVEWVPVREGKMIVAEKLIQPATVPYRAPSDVGFFRFMKDGEEVMRGAAFLDDARQGDFSACSRFVHNLPPSVQERRERLSLPDPLVPLWVALVVAALIAAWWPVRRKLA